MNKLSALALSSFLVVSAAYAEGDMGASEKMPSEQQFSALDANQDGVLDESEASSNTELTNNWASVDIDKDGVVSPQEYSIYTGEATASGSESEEQILEEPVTE
ncbi:hypothetical protein HCH_04867 [Hahella chejuensis KCTC 2396]|uniref:EF-hand domain-containing protein n=1 Tax=Hahella chejuensis (strain KCTC 2396) TaxID=349521 RepID=Q2SCR6_HAHCH|nr:hypothetical protein [Hahella chejuensis]ABC31558.1 hypothetical protein HCH_04867 [Hahella chejuensis KCTC 2396]